MPHTCHPRRKQSPASDPIASARAAGLTYVNANDPGIRRVRKGKSDGYVGHDGSTIRDAGTLARIRSLAIPPAWTNVWICSDAKGHIQAIGFDARGRRQYRYHTLWQEVRTHTKFHRLIDFAGVLPRIRTQIAKHLRSPSLTREKVLAAVVRLLDITGMRVGNEEYAKENHSFGLTTLQNRHVDVHGSDIVFHFRGKSGKVHTIGIKDDRLARIIHSCEELPGQHLFEYRDAQGECHPIESVHVNAFLRACAGQDCSAKEYRTWKATVLAAHLLQHQQIPTSRRQVQKLLHSLVCHVAQHLGNTPAVCRSYYIHPAVFEAFLEGALHAAFRKINNRHRGLHVAEQAALGILEWYEHRRPKVA